MSTSHQVVRGWGAKLSRWVPFGIGHVKPKHFRDMVGIIWRNRDNLRHAWRVLTKGVCDGCALGVAGLYDWTISGPHLCMTRLNLLRLNTVSAFDPSLLADVSKLQALSNAELRELGRIPYPMVRKRGEPGFTRISWSEVNQRLGARLRACGPRRMAFFVTARGVTNEIYYMAQKAVRYMGSNNVDNAARLCHAPSTAAMKAAVGVTATTCSYKDWYGTDLIIFFGSNPANDQPVTTKYLHEAKLLGTKVIMVNPLLEPGMDRYWVPSTASSALFGTNIADYWFPVAQGGDIAFISGVLKLLVEEGGLNQGFIDAHTTGFESLAKHVRDLQWPVLEKQAGLSRSSFVEFAQLIREARNAVLVWSMGITQHVYGSDAVRMVLNLGLARGYVGRDKCGLMPIRGHSSVQGGAEMGAYCSMFPGSKPITASSAAELSKLYGFEVPEWVGLSSVEMVDASARGELDVLYCLGGNLLRTLPDPDYVRGALERVPVRVHQDLILTDQVFIEAREEVYLLPAKTRYEQDDGGMETTTERRVIFSPEIPRQVGEARAEWKILRDLAVAAYPERQHLMGCETGWQMREEIARVVPIYSGVQNLRKTGDEFQYGGAHLCRDGVFPTSDGKARFGCVSLPNLDRSANQFELSTRRGKQFNTLIYAEIDPLTGAGRDSVLMSASDASALGLGSGRSVRLRSSAGEFVGRVFIAPIAPGNVQVHWPEGNGLLARGLVDPAGGVPDYNSKVTIEPL